MTLPGEWAYKIATSVMAGHAEIVPLYGVVNPGVGVGIIEELARKNDKRPARLTAIIPDEWVPNLRGDSGQRDNYWIIRTPARIEPDGGKMGETDGPPANDGPEQE